MFFGFFVAVSGRVAGVLLREVLIGATAHFFPEKGNIQGLSIPVQPVDVCDLLVAD